MKIFSALTLAVPFMVTADTTYQACVENETLLAQFYHAKHIGMLDYYAKGLHDSSTRKLEDLAQNFRSDKVYMTALKELVENDPEVAAEILDQKMKKNEKPFNVLSDFEKEYGVLASNENGKGASIMWTDERQMEIELCDVKYDVADLGQEGKNYVRYALRVCSYLVLVPKKMPGVSAGYRYYSKINSRYNLEPLPDRKVVSGKDVFLLKTIDQYKGFPIMPKEEFITSQVEKKCGKDPKKAEYAMINFSERGNEKANLPNNTVPQQLKNARVIHQ